MKISFLGSAWYKHYISHINLLIVDWMFIYSNSCMFGTVFPLLNTKKIFWRMLATKQLTVAIDFHRKVKYYVNGYRQLFGCQHPSKYLPLCSTEERNSYRFGTTSGWVNDRIFIFGWSFSLRCEHGTQKLRSLGCVPLHFQTRTGKLP